MGQLTQERVETGQQIRAHRLDRPKQKGCVLHAILSIRMCALLTRRRLFGCPYSVCVGINKHRPKSVLLCILLAAPSAMKMKILVPEASTGAHSVCMYIYMGELLGSKAEGGIQGTPVHARAPIGALLCLLCPESLFAG